MRHFHLNYGKDHNEILNQQQLAAFISGAVFNNKDVQSFFVTELDDRLSPFQAVVIANKFGLAAEVIDRMEKGDSPVEALLEWVK